MTQQNTQERAQKAKERVRIIMQVRSGEITAKEGAKRLGISRKSYYQWEKRGLQGMLQALEEQPSGRPKPKTDPEKESLRKEVDSLRQELEVAKQSAAVKKLFHAWELQKAKDKEKAEGSKKKKR